MRNQTRVGRINRTADLLKTIKPSRFKMNIWADRKSKCKVNLTCGSAACALGWEASQRRAHRAGLKMTIHPSVGCEPEIIFTDKKGLQFRFYQAAEEYYGITGCEAYQIFDHESYENHTTVRKSQVIKRLRALAKKYQKIS